MNLWVFVFLRPIKKSINLENKFSVGTSCWIFYSDINNRDIILFFIKY